MSTTSITQTQKRSAIPACLLAWLLPGAGHLYLGRSSRGLLFMGVIGAMFVLGVAMDARLEFYMGLEDPLAFFRSAAQVAIGLPYVIARSIGFGPGEVRSVVHEYGNTFTEVGGLLNILIVLDAYDVAHGRRPRRTER